LPPSRKPSVERRRLGGGWSGPPRQAGLKARPAFKARQPLTRLHLLRAIDRRAIDGVAEHLDRLVVGEPVDRKRDAVLAAVREGKPGRVAERRDGSMQQFRGQRQRPQGFWADALDAEQ